MLSRLLEQYAARLPYRHIPMPDGKPYLIRYLVAESADTSIYLHHYIGSDAERWLHDHPWRQSVGIPLVGSYVEERLVALDPYCGPITRFRRIRRFFPNVITARTFHRIVSVTPGTWTLFIGRDRFKEWGFLEPYEDGDPKNTRLCTMYWQPNDIAAKRRWSYPSSTPTDLKAA